MTVTTKVRKNESFKDAVERFRRDCAKNGVFQEVRKRERYQKPSVRKKLKAQASRKKKRK